MNTQELYQSVSFGKLVTLRESLLPLLKAMGVSAHPQLRAPCHNKRLLRLDCSVQLREGTVFVMEPLSSATVPTLQLENISARGDFLVSWDLPASPEPPSLLLLCDGNSAVSASSVKSSIQGHMSGQAGVVSVGVTEPLLRLSRHLLETSKVLSHNLPSQTNPSTDGTWENPAPGLAQPSEMWRFSQELVRQLAALQVAAVQQPQVSFSRPSSAASVHSRSVRATDNVHSPRNTHSSEGSHHVSPPAAVASSLQSRLSTDSSSFEAGATADQPTTPTSPASQSPLDTSGADLPSSDDMHLSSGSHNHEPVSSSLSADPAETSVNSQSAVEWVPDVAPLQHVLQTPPTQLSHSIFGLLRIDSVSVSFHVESSTSFLRLAG